MQLLHVIQGYKQDPTRYFHFEDFRSVCGDFIFIPDGFDARFLPLIAGFRAKKIVRLDFEEPNKFFLAQWPDYDKYFYKIFTICPYTADWLNDIYGVKKRTPIFFPISEKYIGDKKNKDIDVLYSGHIISDELRKELMELSRFNHAIISNSVDTLVTHRAISYEAKMKMYARSKITLVHNIIFKTYPHRYMNVWKMKDWRKNAAFAQIPPPWRFWELFTKNIYVPQLKSRVFEAAMGGSLILCRRDDFNIIERYFTPGKEFVYYERGKLTETITQILTKYPKYEKIAENAHRRAVREYTVRAFVRKYLKNL